MFIYRFWYKNTSCSCSCSCQVQFHLHSFPCVHVQVQVHLHSDKDNIFKSIPETSSSCDQCDPNLPIISTIVAFINSYVHKVPLSSVSSNVGEVEHSHTSEYPAALKFCPKSWCFFFFKHSLLTRIEMVNFILVQQIQVAKIIKWEEVGEVEVYC